MLNCKLTLDLKWNWNELNWTDKFMLYWMFTSIFCLQFCVCCFEIFMFYLLIVMMNVFFVLKYVVMHLVCKFNIIFVMLCVQFPPTYTNPQKHKQHKKTRNKHEQNNEQTMSNSLKVIIKFLDSLLIIEHRIIIITQYFIDNNRLLSIDTS